MIPLLLLLAVPCAHAAGCADFPFCYEDDQFALALIQPVDAEMLQGQPELLVFADRGETIWLALLRPKPEMHLVLVDFSVVLRLKDGHEVSAQSWITKNGTDSHEWHLPFVLMSDMTDKSPSGRSLVVALTFPPRTNGGNKWATIDVRGLEVVR